MGFLMNGGAPEKINVLAVFSGLRNRDYVHRVTPLRFRRTDGSVHKILKIRRVYRDQKGSRIFVHFVIQTEEDRYFDIVFDPLLSVWQLLLEIDTPGFRV